MLYRFSIENCLFFLWLYQNFHSSFLYRLVAVSVTFFAVRNVINHAPTTKITSPTTKTTSPAQKNHALYMDLVDCYPAILLFFLRL